MKVLNVMLCDIRTHVAHRYVSTCVYLKKAFGLAFFGDMAEIRWGT